MGVKVERMLQRIIDQFIEITTSLFEVLSKVKHVNFKKAHEDKKK